MQITINSPAAQVIATPRDIMGQPSSATNLRWYLDTHETPPGDATIADSDCGTLFNNSPSEVTFQPREVGECVVLVTGVNQDGDTIQGQETIEVIAGPAVIITLAFA